MRDIIRKTPIERLCVSVSISPLEMALALAGLNPNMRIGDVPSEHFEYVDMVRKALAKALRIYRNEKTATDEACHALDVLLAAFLFTDPSTPEIIIQKIEEAIDDLRGTKGWEDKARKLGGLALIRHIKDTNKSGRGLHRREDEAESTDKLMAMLIKLLAEKHGEKNGGKYGTSAAPILIAIFNDIEQLAKNESIPMKGIGKSTFYKKVKASELALNFAED